MSKQKLKIVLTDGKIKKKIAWLYISKKKEPIMGFGYTEFVNRLSQDFHFTFHKDGNQSYRFYGDRKLYVKVHIPWNNQGIHHLQTFNVIPDVQEQSLWVNYVPEKRDIVLEINNSQYIQDNCRILVEVYVLEQKKTELIQKVYGGKLSTPSVHIFEQFDPWVVVCIYKIKSQT